MSGTNKFIVVGGINKAYSDINCEKYLNKIGKVKVYKNVMLPVLINEITNVLKKYNAVIVLLDMVGYDLINYSYYYAAIVYNKDWDFFGSIVTDIVYLRDKCPNIVYNVVNDINIAIYIAYIARNISNPYTKYNVHGLYFIENDEDDILGDDEDEVRYLRFVSIAGNKLFNLVTRLLYTLHEYKYIGSKTVEMNCTMNCIIKYLLGNKLDNKYFVMLDDGLIRLPSGEYGLLITTSYAIIDKNYNKMYTNNPEVYFAVKYLSENVRMESNERSQYS